MEINEAVEIECCFELSSSATRIYMRQNYKDCHFIINEIVINDQERGLS